MSSLSRQQVDQLRSTLQDAAIRCSERCLYQSAKWVAELSSSLPSLGETTPTSENASDSFMQDVDQQTPQVSVAASTNSDPEEARLEAQEFSRYLLAKSYFDCREYDRCASVFLPIGFSKASLATSSSPTSQRSTPRTTKGKGKVAERSSAASGVAVALPHLSQKSLFLALYAKYMAGEKRRDEDSEMALGPNDNGSTVNKELVAISRSLESWFAERETKGKSAQNQGWLEYLYGIVSVRGKTEDDAKQWLLKSISIFQYNWGAWIELSELVGSQEELQRVASTLPQNVMSMMFHLHCSQTLFQSDDAIYQELEQLEGVFPSSVFLKTERALLLYHQKDFQEAERVFTSLLHEDPHRLDSIDHFSNILYVMESRPKLAFLAQVASATDKFRPETCCVVGNYYALKSEHEKAVMYFRRALTLDRNFLSAWTLMGHEYVEMKNTHAAIESYRRAVDINRKDYRAWYGLGQTYEILEMNLYALFYYQKAAGLRPYDPKMWQAVGNCYDRIGKPSESIRALRRALVAGSYYDTGGSFGSSAAGEDSAGPKDPEILYQIALMYEKLAQFEEAAEYMEMTIAQEEGPMNGEDDLPSGLGTGVTNTTSRARMWLARWAFSKSDFPRALELANELCQDGVEVEEAKALIRDIRARTESSK